MWNYSVSKIQTLVLLFSVSAFFVTGKLRRNDILPRGVISTSIGLLGYRSAGSFTNDETPIFCFHTAVRSSDEYTEILPHLSGEEGRFVLALDFPGSGFSEPQPLDMTFDDIADTMIQIADDLRFRKIAVIGSLMGGYVAINMAARYPRHVASVVLSNPYKFLDSLVALAQDGVDLDVEFDPVWVAKPDGSHFTDIWVRRHSFIDDNLNTRLTQDHVTYQINGLASYDLGVTTLIPALNALFDWNLATQVQAPVLALFGEVGLEILDSFFLDATGQLDETVALFPDIEYHIIPTGTLWQINELPSELSAIILAHINS